VTFYTAHFYALYFLQTILKLDFVAATWSMMAAVFAGAPLFVLFGGLSDRLGRRPVILAGLIGAALCYVPAYAVMRAHAGEPVVLTACIFIQILFAAMAYGPLAAFLTELFPARVRVTSLAVPYNVGNGIFGGFTPLIGLALVAWTGNALAGLAYPIAVALANVAVNLVMLRPGDLDPERD
jgi:MFS family permease